MASVSLRNIVKRFGRHDEVTAVDDVSIELDDGEFLVLVGPSGCGKSTLLRIVGGLEESTSGEVYVGERLVNDVPPRDRNMAMVFQSYALYPQMTVFDNLGFSMKLARADRASIWSRVTEVARMLELEELLDRRPRELSGGQRQRVALGRSIVRQPEVFLMDEPLSNLDAKLRVQMRTEIGRLHQRLRTTTIYVTHDQVEAMTLGQRVAILRHGRLQQLDDPRTVYNNPANMFVAGFIGSPSMNFLPGRLLSDDTGLVAELAGQRHPLPDEFALLRSFVGKEVTFGLRPEDVYPVLDGPDMDLGAAHRAEVSIVEVVGAETLLHLDMGTGTDVVGRAGPMVPVRPGDRLDVRLDLRQLHVFDAAGESLTRDVRRRGDRSRVTDPPPERAHSGTS